MLDGRVLEASQVEYEPFGKTPLRERLSCTHRTRARETRIQDAAVEATLLQQATLVFSALFVGCVRQRGVSQALVRRASLRANMHVQFVLKKTMACSLFLLAMFLRGSEGTAACSRRATVSRVRPPFHVMLSASKAHARGGWRARTGLPDLPSVG